MIEQSVFVVDDDEAVCDSIKELVESVGLHAQTFTSAQSFLDAYPVDAAGCLILDVRMFPISGPVLQQRLKEMGASLPIVFITGHGKIDIAVEAMKAGAVDFIRKPYHEQALLDVVNKALEQDAKNRDNVQRKKLLADRVASLTSREREVMELLTRGLTNKVIGVRLGISVRTVEVHRMRVLEKCGVKSVTQLAGLFAEAPEDTPVR